MQAFLLACPAILLSIVAWIVYRRSQQARLFVVAIFLGMGYWYVLPGTLFLLGSTVTYSDDDLLVAYTAIEQAILIVHVTLLLLLLLPAFFSLMRTSARSTPVAQQPYENSSRLNALLLATVVSAVLFLVSRYADLGPEIALQLLLGVASAREFMTFYNFSTSATESLLALWEIINIFLSVFMAATFTWQRRMLSLPFLGASMAAVLSFVSSGSRTVLLLLLFSVAIALICRPRQPTDFTTRHLHSLARRSWLSLLLMAGLVVMAGIAMQARFEGSPEELGSLVIGSVGVHNDMFRELVFVLKHGANYRSDGLLFLLTPISYAMPSFLGFSKSISPHLIDFNLDRAGIDLIYGVGNVFPGLIGDLVLCFGAFAPIVLCILSAVMFVVFKAVTTRGSMSAVNCGLLVTLLCYYVVSFRNMQGSFGILLVISAVLSVALSVTRSSYMHKRLKAR